MVRGRLNLALAGLFMVATGCAEDPTIPAGETSRVASSVAASLETPEAMAEIVALAMADEAVQTSIRDAMRRSTYSEHQLEFQRFLAGESGQPLLTAAARAAGITRNEFLHAAKRLPTMDFFVPRRLSRRDWRPGRPLLVAAVEEEDTWTTKAFSIDGTAMEYDGRRPGAWALFLLVPAEHKVERPRPQQERGEHIEDAGTTNGITLAIETPSGPRSITVADRPASSAWYVGGAKNASLLLPEGTYYRTFRPFFSDGLAGGCEVVFKAYFVPNGSTSNETEYKRYPATGHISGDCTEGGDVLWTGVAGMLALYSNPIIAPPYSGFPNNKVAIEVWELDTSSSDDNMGWVNFYGTADSWTTNGHGGFYSLAKCEESAGNGYCNYTMSVEVGTDGL